VSVNNIAALWVIDGSCEVLYERAIEPYVQGLRAAADGQNRLVEVEGVLQEELIDGGAGWVGLATFGEHSLAVSLRIYIEFAAGQKHSLDPGKEAGYTVLMLVQRNDDGGSSSGTEGGKIGRQCPLVISRIYTGGLGNGNMDAHGRNQCKHEGGKGDRGAEGGVKLMYPVRQLPVVVGLAVQAWCACAG